MKKVQRIVVLILFVTFLSGGVNTHNIVQAESINSDPNGPIWPPAPEEIR